MDAPLLEYASLQGVYAVVGVDSEKEWPKNHLSGSVGLQNAPLLHNGSTYSLLGGVVVPATPKNIETERQSCGFRFSLYVYCSTQHPHPTLPILQIFAARLPTVIPSLPNF